MLLRELVVADANPLEMWFEIRKRIAQLMPVGDVKTIFIVRDSFIKNFEKENVLKIE